MAHDNAVDRFRHARTGSGQPLTHLRLDGKTVRRGQDADGNQRHLLAVLTGPPDKVVAAAQAEVGAAKPRETITARDHSRDSI